MARSFVSTNILIETYIMPQSNDTVSRRQFSRTAIAAASTVAIGLSQTECVSIASGAQLTTPMRTNKVKYCLNTSTIRSKSEVLPIVEQLAVAQKAGYDAIEFWLKDIEKYMADGGKLPELRKRIVDSGLTVESSIAFSNWIVDDEEVRKKGLEQARKDMDTVTAIGGIRIAAPPAGATNSGPLNLDQAGDRYRALLEVGKVAGCIAQLEVWGFSKNLSKLSEVLYVAAAAQHPDACVLPDIYHLYKGGSSFNDLNLLSGKRIHVFHMNDYPDMPRDKINDADRVFPGEGISPVSKILSTVFASGFDGVLSIELFNKTYWQQDPNTVAAKGLASMKLAVSQAK